MELIKSPHTTQNSSNFCVHRYKIITYKICVSAMCFTYIYYQKDEALSCRETLYAFCMFQNTVLAFLNGDA
jgi:hypothetical protein